MLEPLYNCREFCGRTRTSPGDPAIRASLRCSLPDFDPAQWGDVDPDAAAVARQLVAELLGPVRAQGIDLDHDLDAHGCPMGWATCEFAEGVAAFVGVRDVGSRRRTPTLRMQLAIAADAARQAQGQPSQIEALVELVELAQAWEDGAIARYHEELNRQ